MDDCIICREPLPEKECVLPCEHSAFHTKCINKLMKCTSYPTCPLCRMHFDTYTPLPDIPGQIKSQLTKLIDEQNDAIAALESKLQIHKRARDVLVPPTPTVAVRSIIPRHWLIMFVIWMGSLAHVYLLGRAHVRDHIRALI